MMSSVMDRSIVHGYFFLQERVIAIRVNVESGDELLGGFARDGDLVGI